MKARTWIASLSGASLALTAALVGVGSLSSANAVVSVVPMPGAGQVVLATNVDSSGAGNITYTPSGATAPQYTQSLATTANNGCIMANPTGGQILNFTPNGTTTSVGYQPGTNGGSIGVSSKGGNSTACTQVNQKEKESLTIDLKGLQSTLSATTLQAIDATFDIEAKGNVIITATLSSGGKATGDVFTLYSGKSQKTTLLPTEANCNVVTVADSGPDAGAGDNCPWTILPTKPFDSVLLTTTQPSGAAFSVEGGGDWGADAAAHRTVFDVATNFEGLLACGATTGAQSSDSGVTSVTVNRLDNGDGAGCKLIPYNLDASASTGTFHKPVGGTQTAAQFTMSFTRTIATTGSLGTTPSPFTANSTAPLKVDWEDGDPTASPAVPDTILNLTYCPAALYTPATATTAATWNWSWLNTNSIDMTSRVNGLQYSCLYGEQTTLQDDGSLTVTDLVYLTGDYKVLG